MVECLYSVFTIQSLSQLHIRTAAISNWRVFSTYFSKTTMAPIINCKIFSFGIRVNPVYLIYNKTQHEGTFRSQKIATYKREERVQLWNYVPREILLQVLSEVAFCSTGIQAFHLFICKNNNVLFWHIVDESENCTICKDKIIFGEEARVENFRDFIVSFLHLGEMGVSV